MPHRLGRRWGLIHDAAVMFLGLLMLTASWGASLNSWVIFYAWSLFIYGIGVGGEYPMTATAAMENPTTGRVADREDRLHRGRKVSYHQYDVVFHGIRNISGCSFF